MFLIRTTTNCVLTSTHLRKAEKGAEIKTGFSLFIQLFLPLSVSPIAGSSDILPIVMPFLRWVIPSSPLSFSDVVVGTKHEWGGKEGKGGGTFWLVRKDSPANVVIQIRGPKCVGGRGDPFTPCQLSRVLSQWIHTHISTSKKMHATVFVGTASTRTSTYQGDLLPKI